MQSRLYLSIIIISAVFFVNPGQPVALAEQGPLSAEPNHPAAPDLPYVAEITGNKVNIRSGPGTNYYPCGKLNKSDRVIVVGTKFSWSQIAPPAGSFSWISTQYVSFDTNKPSVGTVTGDNVRVYAGSDNIPPMRSTSLQVKLSKGEKVKLFGQEKEGYYKISPPEGAYLWVLSQYTTPLGAVGDVPVIVERPGPMEEEKGPVSPAIEPETASSKLKEYYALQKQLEAESGKAMGEQNYENLRKSLTEIANNKSAGKAARYAEHAIAQIQRCELAIQVTKELKLQQQQLQQTRQRIEKARQARLTKIENLGRFAVIGRFQTFVTYGPGHFRIIGDAGKTVCYALPSGPAESSDLSKYIGQYIHG